MCRGVLGQVKCETERHCRDILEYLSMYVGMQEVCLGLSVCLSAASIIEDGACAHTFMYVQRKAMDLHEQSRTKPR